jgi:inner membrane protein
MDLITQAVLGAAVGQAIGTRKLGRQAVIWGAIGGMIPDLDVLIGLRGPLYEIIYHRGLTHSLWFGPVVGTILGWLLWRWRGGHCRTWIHVMIWSLLTHPLLDVFTVYGTQLLAPFSLKRFTIPAVPIIDPVYTGLLAWSLWWARRRLHKPYKVMAGTWLLLIISTGYLGLGYYQNTLAVQLAKQQLIHESIVPERVKAFPTMFQIFLRRIVVQTPTTTRIGFVSTWAPQSITWAERPRFSLPFHDRLQSHETYQLFKWFTDDMLHIESVDDTRLKLQDLRYGFPGPTLWGIWGFEVTHTPSQEPRFEFFRARIRPRWQQFRDLWFAAFGLSDNFMADLKVPESITAP